METATKRGFARRVTHANPLQQAVRGAFPYGMR